MVKLRARLVNAAYMTLLPILSSAVALPATIYVMHSVGPLTYGQWAIGNTWVGVGLILTNLGLRPLYSASVARNPGMGAESLAYQLGLRLLMALAAQLLITLLCLSLHYPPVVLISTLIAVAGLYFTASAAALEDFLTGIERFQEIGIMQTISGFILTGLSVVAAFHHGDAIALSLAYLSGPVSFFVMLAWAVRRTQTIQIRFDFARFRDLLFEARLIGFSAIISVLRDRAEQFLIPQIAGFEKFGLFTSGVLLPDRFGNFASGMPSAFFPAIAAAYEKDRETAVHQTGQVVFLALFFTLPLSILLFAFAHPLAHLIAPKQEDLCFHVLIITVWAVPLMCLLQTISIALQAARSHDAWARASLAASFASIALSIGSTFAFGILGACFSWVARPLVGTLFCLPAFFRSYPGILPHLRLLQLLLSALGMVTVLALSDQFLSTDHLLPVVFTASLSVIAYGGLTILVGAIKWQELRRLARS